MPGSERLSVLGENEYGTWREPLSLKGRITSYNVCYTKLLRYETVAGFIMEKTGDIPAVGISVVESGWMFTVAEREGNKIAAVRLDRLSGGAS